MSYEIIFGAWERRFTRVHHFSLLDSQLSLLKNARVAHANDGRRGINTCESRIHNQAVRNRCDPDINTVTKPYSPVWGQKGEQEQEDCEMIKIFGLRLAQTCRRRKNCSGRLSSTDIEEPCLGPVVARKSHPRRLSAQVVEYPVVNLGFAGRRMCGNRLGVVCMNQ